jgi:hypothetical protein
MTSRGERGSIEFTSKAGFTKRIGSRRRRRLDTSDQIVLEELVDMSRGMVTKSSVPEISGDG